jgi:lipoprotein-releasing system permease protein
VPGVATRTPSAEGQVIAVAGDKVRGVLLRGMSPDDFRARTPLRRASRAAGVRERYRNLCRSDDGKPSTGARSRTSATTSPSRSASASPT